MVFSVGKTKFATAMRNARDLLEETKGELPVDICRIAGLLGYTVEEAEIRWAGYVAAKENVIVVRRSDPVTRKRFTIAHEIGHVLLGKSCEGTVNEKKLFKGHVYCKEERIADHLATELLMPMIEFQAELQCYTYPSFRTVFDIARLFGVSFIACARRITEIPSLVGFLYSYEICNSSLIEYDVTPKRRYSTGNKLRFLTPPFDVIRKCLQHSVQTNTTWSGEIRFQKDEEQIQIPSVGKVISKGSQTWLTLLGWRHLDSPVLARMQANQLVAF